MLCCSSEITQNMVLQLLKNFKVEINFGAAIWIKVSSGYFQIEYIRTLSKEISAPFSKGVKVLIKELPYAHI